MAEQPHEIVWKLSTAGFGARCLHLVADLGVADRIGDSPVPVTDLADSCAVKADAVTASCDCSQRMVCSKNKTAATATRSRPGCSAPTIPELCGRSPR
jgi:hypothetical protein